MKAHSFAVSGTRKTATVVSILCRCFILTFSVSHDGYSFMEKQSFILIISQLSSKISGVILCCMHSVVVSLWWNGMN